MSGQATLSQVEKMTTQPIPKLITTLAVPTIISMLITSIYNIGGYVFSSPGWVPARPVRWDRLFPDGDHSGSRLHAGHLAQAV